VANACLVIRGGDKTQYPPNHVWFLQRPHNHMSFVIDRYKINMGLKKQSPRVMPDCHIADSMSAVL
jgi:hypothetical protein